MTALRDRLIAVADGRRYVAYCRICTWAKGEDTETAAEHIYRLHRAICPGLTTPRRAA